MGYSTRPEMLTDHYGLLLAIKIAVDKNKELSLECGDENISTYQYRLRRVLAATDHFPLEQDGQFAMLGSRTSLNIDSMKNRILVRRKGASKINLPTPISRTEKDIPGQLALEQGEMTMIEFEPSSSYNREAFAAELSEYGWTLHLNSEVDTESGLMYAVERIETKAESTGGFDMLRRDE